MLDGFYGWQASGSGSLGVLGKDLGFKVEGTSGLLE